MQLFSRQRVLGAPTKDAMAWAMDIREYASGVIDNEIALWSAIFGAPVGSVGFAMRVDGLADVAAKSEQLNGDAGYHERLAAGERFMLGPAQDALLQPVHGSLGSDSPPLGSIATLTQATIVAAYDQVIQWGIEMSELAEGIIDAQVLFGTSQYGSFGDVTWIVVAADAEAADAMNGKLAASPEYIAKLSSSTGLFVPGSGRRTLMTRVA